MGNPFVSFMTGVSLIRNTLHVRHKFQQLVDIKVQGYNGQYAGTHPPLRRPQNGLLDQVIGCFISPATCWNKLTCCCTIPRPSLPDSEWGKSVTGLVIGLLISWLYFWILVSVLRAPRSLSAPTGVTVLLTLSLGLAFVQRMRLLSLVSLATVCSSTGRVIVFAFILLLMYRGPIANVTENAVQLGKAMGCSAAEAGQAAKHELAKVREHGRPIALFYRQLNDSVNRHVERIQQKAKKVRQAATEMRDAAKEIADLMPDMPAFEGNLLSGLYRWGTWYIPDNWINKIAGAYVRAKWSGFKSQVRASADRIHMRTKHQVNRTLEKYRVNIAVDRQLNHSSTQNKNWSDILSAIASDIESQTRWIGQFFLFLRLFHPLLTLLVLVRAVLYVRAYRKKLHFDNCYITWRLHKIDASRAQVPNCETLLPLTAAEAAQYMHPLSLRLTVFEKRKLVIGLMVIGSYLVFAGTYMLADWSLYQSVQLVSRHRGDFSVQVQAPQCTFGQGDMDQLYADIDQSIGTACSSGDQIMNKTQETVAEMAQCFPSPSEPDYDVYRRIGLLLLICLITTLAEAYTLRLRHAACDYFFPERGDQRAGWLYNSILALRGSFASVLADRYRARLGFHSVETVSLMDRLVATVPCMRLLQSSDLVFCARCGKRGQADEDWDECDSCRAVRYCARCVSLLNNVCSSCQEAIAVPDSDLSLEEDSEGAEDDWQAVEVLPADVQAMRKKMRRLGHQFTRTGVTRDVATADWDDVALGTQQQEGSRVRLERESGVSSAELDLMSDRAQGFLR